MSSPPRIALATCTQLPEWEVDDQPFHAALRERGAALEHPSWDDQAVDWSRYDAVLIRTTWDYQAHPDAFQAWTRHAAQRTQLFNPPELIAWNLHKGYLRDLAELGVPIAPSVWCPAGEAVDLRAVLAARAQAEPASWSSGRAFLKPQIGANALDTLRFDSGDPQAVAGAQAHLDAMVLGGGKGMLLQPYLASVETLGELSIIELDGRFSHGVRKVPVSGDYRVQDDYGAHDEPWVPDAEALALAQLSLERTAARFPELDEPLLYARVDLLRDDAGRYVLNELELIEPSLFFRHGHAAADADGPHDREASLGGAHTRLAEALLARVSARAR